MAKKRRRRTSMKRRSNGRYQMKRAMHHGRVKAKYKRQAKNRERTQGDCIFEGIIYLFFMALSIFYLYYQVFH